MTGGEQTERERESEKQQHHQDNPANDLISAKLGINVATELDTLGEREQELEKRDKKKDEKTRIGENVNDHRCRKPREKNKYHDRILSRYFSCCFGCWLGYETNGRPFRG